MSDMDPEDFQAPLIVDEVDDIVDLERSVNGTIEEAAEHKTRIEKYLIEERKIDIVGLTEECSLLLEESSALKNEISAFQDDVRDHDIRHIAETDTELEKILTEMRNVEWNLQIVRQLVECDELLNDYKRLKLDGDLEEAVNTLSRVTDLLNNPCDGLEQLDLYKNVKVDAVSKWELLLNELSKMWRAYLEFEDIEDDSKKITENRVTIEFKTDDDEGRSKLFRALVSSKQVYMEMKIFSRFLLDRVFYRMIHYHAIIDTPSNTSNRINVTFILNKKNKPNYEIILDNLKTIFDFLSKNLQLESADGVCALNMIGDMTCYEFSDVLIKDCLVHTIPNCISELQDYGKVTSRVEEFQLYLSSIKFLKTENFSILQYANNIDVLFANKTSQYFLESARTILKKDLGNMMSVGVEIKNDPILINDENLTGFYESFEVSPFRFPLCAISKSVRELLDLVIVMMEQATEASDMCARRLYYTARNVFELYIAIVPLHHKTFLETMPQQVALFHNNCMYLAHNLLMLGPKWKKTLSNRDLNYTIVFCDQVKELRDLAANALLSHMRIQKKQLLDTIRSSDLYYIATKDVLSENAEQAIRQCIRQLQVLKTVWSGIFPSDIYKKLITCLVNVFVEELILKVVIQEDITADVATQLTDLYKIVLNRLPHVYQDDADIHKNVSSWTKFNELIIVLGGTLATIEERWFNGSGPMALQFKPDEIKRLIRALFQNTTFRANLLSKIK